MAEWSIAAVLKTVKPKGFGGSNPSVSARFFGEMPEWSIGAVSKTVERFAFQGFESLSLRRIKAPCVLQGAFIYINQKLFSEFAVDSWIINTIVRKGCQ